MNIQSTRFEDVYIIENFHMADLRGEFVKFYHEEFFKSHNLCTSFKENYYTVSQKNVIRGMHFQLPPFDHNKLVHVISGAITDVILDLRKHSPTYKQYFEITLNAAEHRSLYIPKGFAHGYKSLEDNTIVVYSVSSVHAPDSDRGIHYNTFGYHWNIDLPILSNKDKNLPSLENFMNSNPF